MARMTPPKSPMVCEKYQTGCMWRLYGLFDFRSHSDKKLLSDKKHSNRFDSPNLKTKLELLNNFDDKCQSMDDQMKNKIQTVNSETRSKKKVKEEKLSTEQQLNKKTASDEVKHTKNGKARNERLSSSISVEKSLNKVNSAAVAEAMHARKRTGCGCKSINGDIIHPHVQKSAAEAIIMQKFIDEKYIRKDGLNHQSKQLSDALDILNSNKDLFIKLLQDPNSLLAKKIEDLKEAQTVKHESKAPSDVNTSEPRQCDVPAGIQKSKSCDIDSSEQSDGFQFSDRIVVLKPGPASMQDSEDNSNKSEMPVKLSFSQIKKKLRRAIGVSRKQQQNKSMDVCEGADEDCKGKGAEIIRRKTPNGEMVMSSLDVKRRDNTGWVREYDSRIEYEAASTSGRDLENLNNSVFHPRRKESESYLEARLLALLNSGNKDKNVEKQEQNSPERVLSFPEYEFLPTRSPRTPVRDLENRLVNEQMRVSKYRNCQLSYENKWRLQKDKLSCLSPTENYGTMYQNETNVLEVPSESESACRNDTVETYVSSPSESLRESDCKEKTNTTEINGTMIHGETETTETPSELNCKEKAFDLSTDTFKLYEEDEYLKSFRQEQTTSVTSSPDYFKSPPRIQRGEDSTSIEVEQPSPVSVLDQFFVDSVSEPAEGHHSVPLVRFPMNLDPSSTSSLNEHEVISEYVGAVLQAASLDWDEISIMCESSDQLLDPFLFDTVKLQTCQFHGDCMLLFDCIDEVLVDVHHNDLRYSPWLSFIKPNVQQLPMEKTVIDKVMKNVAWNLLPHASPRTVQKLVEVDITQSGTWISIRKDAEDMVFQMVDDVLEEMIIDTITSE